MDYVRKTFTLPRDLATQLGNERNQSDTVAQALRLHFDYRSAAKRAISIVAEHSPDTDNTSNISDMSDALKLTQPQSIYQTHRRQCCSLGDSEHAHWYRNGDFIINSITGERKEV